MCTRLNATFSAIVQPKKYRDAIKQLGREVVVGGGAWWAMPPGSTLESGCDLYFPFCVYVAFALISTAFHKQRKIFVYNLAQKQQKDAEFF